MSGPPAETPADFARHILYGVERCFRKSNDLSGWIGDMSWEEFTAGMDLLEQALAAREVQPEPCPLCKSLLAYSHEPGCPGGNR